MTHFTKLVQDKAVAINDVLPEDKLKSLSKLFENYNEETLNTMKEQVGEDFSWNELRLFKASLNV